MPKDNQHQTYPRPDFQRPDLTWLSLNGTWDFLFDDTDIGLQQCWHQQGLPQSSNSYASSQEDSIRKPNLKGQIQVPYVFQTPASGIDNQDAHEVLWYERSLHDIRNQNHVHQHRRLLLRFGAVDYEATIWVNGAYVGSHRGGHVPFDIDITDALSRSSDENRLTVRVRDSPYDLTQPRGKQYWKPQPEHIFYTPSSGIWQNVWLEVVPEVRIEGSSHGTILRTNDVLSGVLHAEVSISGRRAQEPLVIEMSCLIYSVLIQKVQQSLPAEANLALIELPMCLDQQTADSLPTGSEPLTKQSAWKKIEDTYLALWSPEHPQLYEIKIKLLDLSNNIIDEVHTTAGMRSISWNHFDRTFRLNEKPYFHALVLDQGYWPRTNITPPSSDALKRDIEISKAMGFNGCRKHQKVEDPQFLYWADKLGYLVWGEMANAYQFSSSYVDRFDDEWKQAVKRDINHACVVVWTPANESWGYNDLAGSKRQRDHLRSLYFTTKSLDPTRPINDNCGWEHVCTDLTTFHEYADAPMLRDICSSMERILHDKGGQPVFVNRTMDDPGCKYSSTAPVICTEFGGVNIAPAQGDQSDDREWGYTTAKDPDDLLSRVEALVMAVVDGGHCCGFVYTQLTDIEQEVNGLYTFDRRPKLDVDKVREIMEKAKARYFEHVESSKARYLDLLK